MTVFNELVDGLETLYEQWLMKQYPDEISNKEDLERAFRERSHRDEFLEFVGEVV